MWMGSFWRGSVLLLGNIWVCRKGKVCSGRDLTCDGRPVSGTVYEIGSHSGCSERCLYLNTGYAEKLQCYFSGPCWENWWGKCGISYFPPVLNVLQWRLNLVIDFSGVVLSNSHWDKIFADAEAHWGMRHSSAASFLVGERHWQLLTPSQKCFWLYRTLGGENNRCGVGGSTLCFPALGRKCGVMVRLRVPLMFCSWFCLHLFTSGLSPCAFTVFVEWEVFVVSSKKEITDCWLLTLQSHLSLSQRVVKMWIWMFFTGEL